MLPLWVGPDIQSLVYHALAKAGSCAHQQGRDIQAAWAAGVSDVAPVLWFPKCTAPASEIASVLDDLGAPVKERLEADSSIAGF